MSGYFARLQANAAAPLGGARAPASTISPLAEEEVSAAGFAAPMEPQPPAESPRVDRSAISMEIPVPKPVSAPPKEAASPISAGFAALDRVSMTMPRASRLLGALPDPFREAAHGELGQDPTASDASASEARKPAANPFVREAATARALTQLVSDLPRARPEPYEATRAAPTALPTSTDRPGPDAIVPPITPPGSEPRAERSAAFEQQTATSLPRPMRSLAAPNAAPQVSIGTLRLDVHAPPPPPSLPQEPVFVSAPPPPASRGLPLRRLYMRAG